MFNNAVRIFLCGKINYRIKSSVILYVAVAAEILILGGQRVISNGTGVYLVVSVVM